MRIIRFLDNQGRTHFGLPRDAGSAELLAGVTLDDLKPTGRIVGINKFLSPVDPVNIFCVGLNYREHAAESRSPIPENPVIFMKPTTAVVHPGDPIRIPACSNPEGEVDYECELAVVIGRSCRDVPVEEALRYVGGYTAANDVSARRWQRGNGGQWIRGKSFDTFCPLGPAMITADEIPDPQALNLSTTLNGQVMQKNTTGDMIFTVAQIIAFLSRDTTLLPNTVILTGTPPGVGFARKPPVWLKAGDTVTIEIDRIGKLANPVVGA